MISGNMVGSYSQMGKTLMLIDENGNEIPGVIVDQEVIFTAHDNDVREGMIYASDEGVSIGSKVIPAYHTTEGSVLISANSEYVIKSLTKLNKYDYTKLQAIICEYNTNMSDSTSAIKVAINDKVYNVQSTDVLSEIIKDSENKKVVFGISNNTGNTTILRYFTYKEIE